MLQHPRNDLLIVDTWHFQKESMTWLLSQRNTSQKRASIKKNSKLQIHHFMLSTIPSLLLFESTTADQKPPAKAHQNGKLIRVPKITVWSNDQQQNILVLVKGVEALEMSHGTEVHAWSLIVQS
jgi:hypothetical protein